MQNLRKAFHKLFQNMSPSAGQCANVIKAVRLGRAKDAARIIADTDFNRKQQTQILRAIIDADSVVLFEAALQKFYQGNVNVRIKSRSKFDNGEGYEDTSKSLIYAAIVAGKSAIALHLAKNPATDIVSSGYDYYYHSPKNKHRTEYPAALDAARRKPGMAEVAAILEQRTAQARLQAKPAISPA